MEIVYTKGYVYEHTKEWGREDGFLLPEEHEDAEDTEELSNNERVFIDKQFLILQRY